MEENPVATISAITESSRRCVLATVRFRNQQPHAD